VRTPSDRETWRRHGGRDGIPARRAACWSRSRETPDRPDLLISGGILVPSHVRKGHCVGRHPFPLWSTGEIWYGLFRPTG
jgi:hypothetical protein